MDSQERMDVQREGEREVFAVLDFENKCPTRFGFSGCPAGTMTRPP